MFVGYTSCDWQHSRFICTQCNHQCMNNVFCLEIALAMSSVPLQRSRATVHVACSLAHCPSAHACALSVYALWSRGSAILDHVMFITNSELALRQHMLVPRCEELKKLFRKESGNLHLCCCVIQKERKVWISVFPCLKLLAHTKVVQVEPEVFDCGQTFILFEWNVGI